MSSASKKDIPNTQVKANKQGVIVNVFSGPAEAVEIEFVDDYY